MRAPEFWKSEKGLLSTALLPLAGFFDLGGRIRRGLAIPHQVPVPVICVGNLVAGGAGKTPVVIALAELLRRQGHVPHIVTRGYGGTIAGPVAVDPAIHDAASVGDEPLLLAAAAPSWVARDRAAGAIAAVAAGAQIILLDDGFQNNSLHHDHDILVIDGGYGFGNGRVMPAGPLRENLARGVARADCAVLIGEDKSGISTILGGRLPILGARLTVRGADEIWRGRRVLAFAGIGRPVKFFETLDRLGVRTIDTASFPDHHPFEFEEICRLRQRAALLDAALVTTEKDLVRMSPNLRSGIAALPVEISWQQPGDVADWVARLAMRRPPAV